MISIIIWFNRKALMVCFNEGILNNMNGAEKKRVRNLGNTSVYASQSCPLTGACWSECDGCQFLFAILRLKFHSRGGVQFVPVQKPFDCEMEVVRANTCLEQGFSQ